MSRRTNAAAQRFTASAPVFFALGDETRLRLVAKLCADGPSSIAELAEGQAITRQAIRKHLVVLAKAGLVRDVEQGRERIFELEAKKLELAKRSLDEISSAWDEALGRLQAFVEQ
ncbi:MAG: winged helix-turn-helix domain-containing protein [Myxococcota bacterium]